MVTAYELRPRGRNNSSVNRSREDLLGDKAASDFWMLMRAWNYAAKNDFRIEACRRLGIHSVTARQVGPLLRQFLDIARREGLDVEPREVPEAMLQKSRTGDKPHALFKPDAAIAAFPGTTAITSDGERVRVAVGGQKAGQPVVRQMHAVRPLIHQNRDRRVRSCVGNVPCHSLS